MIKNNNPGNIRPLPDKDGKPQSWLGSTGVSDKNFVIFSTLQYGLRAYFKSLHTAVFLHGRSTIRMIISSYAPPTGADGGNDTESYIKEMCTACKISDNEPIKWNKEFLITFATEQLKIETGVIIDTNILTQGLEMANIIL